MSWVELRKPWHDTSVDYCDVCGNLLIHEYWEFNAGGEIMRACREDDEQLWARLETFRATYPSTIENSFYRARLTDTKFPQAKE